MALRRLKLIYPVAGAMSGMIWFVVALALDRGWSIPNNQNAVVLAALLCAAFVGVFISLLFRSAFHRASVGMFILLPFATLPLATVMFAILLWSIRQLLAIQPVLSFESITGTYILGGLLSIFTPVLLVLSFANQYAMRLLLRKFAAESTQQEA